MDVKARLEGELNGPSLSGKVSAEFKLEKNNLSKETETTISINWSGGGSIKHPSEEWNIGSLKRAAAGVSGNGCDHAPAYLRDPHEISTTQ